MACKIFFLTLCLFSVILQIQCSMIDQLSDYNQDIRYLQLDIDGEQYNLSLKQRLREVMNTHTPVWTVKSSDDGYVFSKFETEHPKIDGIFYDDEKYMANLMAWYDDDDCEIYYDGVIGVGANKHTVRSFLQKLWTPLASAENEKQSNDEKVVTEKIKLRPAYALDDQVNTSEELPLSVLHPEILIVVDNKLYKQLDENIYETLKYVATYWNAVDLRYNKLDRLKFEIEVTGVIIITDEESDFADNAREFFGEKSIENDELVNYDATFVMTTTSNIVNLQEKPRYGSICNKLYSTTFVKDDANYGGIETTIHALGHMLGVPHDGHDKAENCKADSTEFTDNTVMSPTVLNAKAVTWSKCSKNILRNFAMSNAADCLRNNYRHE